MAEITIENLGLRLESESAKSRLEVKSSIQLILPEELQGLNSREELLQLVSSGQLWVARIGSCTLTVEVTTLGSALSTAEGVLVKEWICDHQLWNQLGIRLVYLGNDTALSSNEISMSIQHPDLASALVAPTKALVAEFLSVRCAIDLSVIKAYSTAHEEAEIPLQESPDESMSNNHLSLHHDVGIDDQRAVLRFMGHIHEPEKQNYKLKNSKRRRISKTQERIENIGVHKKAIDTAVRVILFGKNNIGNSYRSLGRASAPGLLQIAPGVFNIPYLQVVTARASLRTIICSSLAKMASAESPTLRQKVAKLKTFLTPGTNNVSQELDVFQGIEQNVWNIILNNSKSLSKTKKKACDPSTQPEHSWQNHDEQLNQEIGTSFSPLRRSSPQVMEICDRIQAANSDELLSSTTPSTSTSTQASSPSFRIQASHIQEYFSSLSQTLWYEAG